MPELPLPGVKSRSSMRGNVNRTLYRFALRVEGIQLVAGCKPDALTVVRHTVHTLDARKRPEFSNDLGGRCTHVSLLAR